MIRFNKINIAWSKDLKLKLMSLVGRPCYAPTNHSSSWDLD